METLAGLPFTSLNLSASGERTGAAYSAPPDITDLIIISHGWKNDGKTATSLYETLLTNVQAFAGDAFRAQGRRWAVQGVFWPAFRFQPDLSLLPEQAARLDEEGGAAAMGEQALPADDLEPYAASIGEALGLNGEAFAASAIAAADGGAPADCFLEMMRERLSRPQDPHALQELRKEHAALVEKPGGDLVDALQLGGQLQTSTPQYDMDGTGDAAGFGDVVSTLRRWRSGGMAAIASILNQATYYEMKARAGNVGLSLAPLVDQIPANVRVHLIGHSFGARLVTALCSGLETRKVQSMTLLQGAFSHNGLGSRQSTERGAAGVDGAFRSVIADKKVEGPIVVTHTQRDTAVGFYYAIASALSGVAAAAFERSDLIGGPSDRYGGIGANGALSLLTDEGSSHAAQLTDAKEVLLAGHAPAFRECVVHNVQCDAIIDDHNNVDNPEVAQLVWAAIR